MQTSDHSTATNGEEKSTYSQEAFPASLFPMQGKEEEKQTTVSSGLKCFALYERSNQHGSSLKTCVGSLLRTEEWYSSACVLRWKPQVTKYSRLIFQLAASEHHTEENGYGLLLTPRAKEAVEEPEKVYNRARKNGYNNRTKFSNLSSFIEHGLLPTPREGSWEGYETRGKRKGHAQAMSYLESNLDYHGLKLQPAFAAWMMGFPENWTELPFQTGETKV